MKEFKDIPEKIAELLPKVRRYVGLLFGLLLLIIYGFLMYRITSLNAQEPSPESVAAQNKTASVPHIDPKLVDQLQSLQDNSSSVQTLFDQARDNPFQE